MSLKMKRRNSFNNIFKKLNTISEDEAETKKQDSEKIDTQSESKLIVKSNFQPDVTYPIELLESRNNIDSHLLEITKNKVEIEKNRKYKYLELLKQFLEEKLEYNANSELSINQIKTKFNDFLANLDEDIKPKDFNVKLNVNDILLFDSRYIYQRINICKYCKKRLKIGCCEKYEFNKLYPIKQKMFLLNIQAKSSPLSIEDEI